MQNNSRHKAQRTVVPQAALGLLKGPVCDAARESGRGLWKDFLEPRRKIGMEAVIQVLIERLTPRLCTIGVLEKHARKSLKRV